MCRSGGSLLALTLGASLYVVVATTGIGLLMSTFTRTQIAALFGTAILTILPTVRLFRADDAGRQR